MTINIEVKSKIFSAFLFSLFFLLFLCFSQSFAQENIRIFVSAPGQLSTDLTTAIGLTEPFYNEGFEGFTPPNNTWATGVGGYTNVDIGSYFDTGSPASTISADGTFGSGDGNYLGIPVGGSVSLELNEPAQYFGFFWAAGDGENRIFVYREGILLFTFGTDDVVSFLPNSTTTRTSFDGTDYTTSDYYGKQAGVNVGLNASQPYAYLHIVSTPGLAFDSLVFQQISGGGFENDNHAVYFGDIPSDTNLPGSWVTVATRTPPQSFNDIISGNLKQPVTIDILSNDTPGDAPLDATSVQILGTSSPGNSLIVPGEGTWSINGTTGEITFTPIAALSGSPTPISYRVSDNATPSLTSNSSTVTVLYQETYPDFANTTVNNAVDGNVSTNDNVVSGTTYDNESLLSGPTGGVLTLNADGSFTFTSPNAGVYLYEYDVIAPGASGPFPTQLLQITVTDPAVSSNLPIANPDIYALLASTTLSGNVLDNDVDLSGSSTPLAVSELNGDAGDVGAGQPNYGGSGGSLTVNADGSISLVNPTVPGTYTFNYTIVDGDGGTSTTTAFITVYPTGTVNVVTASDDFNAAEQGSRVSGNLLTNDSQLDTTDPLRVVDPSDALNTTIPFTLVDGSGNQLTINPSTGSYDFIPVLGFDGSTSFTYTAIGTDDASATATAYFTVFPLLDVNADIGSSFVNESLAGSAATNDRVPTGSTYTATPVSSPVGATISFSMNTDGTYTFETNTPGVYVYNVEVCAPTTPPGCETRTLTITVTSPSLATNPPVAHTDLATTGEEIAVIINVLANDQPGVPDNAGKALTPPPGSISTPSNGTAVLSGNNIEYTPNPGFTGTDSFTYQICDAASVCATATVFVDVYPAGIGNLVLAADDYALGTISSDITGNVLNNDTQLDDATNLTVQGPVTDEAITGGELTLNGDGSFSFSPDPSFFGTTSYIYTTVGTDGATASATLHITVGRGLVLTFQAICINDIPYLSFDLLTNFDPDGLDINILWTTGTAPVGIPNPGSVPLVPTVSQTITPASGDWTLNAGAYEYTGQTLWPGVAESGGIPTDWPGWVDLGSGNWVFREDGFSGYRTNPGVVFSVNPDAEITSGDLGYPPPTPICASSPGIAVSGTVWNDENNSGQPDFTAIFDAGESGSNFGGLNVVIIGEDLVTPGQDIIYAILTVASNGTYSIPDFVRGTDYTLVLTYDVSGLSINDVVADPNAIAMLPPAVVQTSPIVRTGVDLLDGVAIENLDFGIRRLLNEWLGTNTNWCDDANWSLGFRPSAGMDIRITDQVNNPSFDGTTCPVCVNNLTIETDASLDLSGDLCVTGDLVSDGPVTGAGSIVLQGTTPQTITGEFNINNLELDNPTGAIITAGAGNMVNIIGELELTDGLLTTNGNITLKSDATGSAYLAPILTCDGSVGFVGDVRVEVYVEGQNRAFRFFGHFFNHTISVQQIRDVIDVTGEGLDFNDTGNPSAFWYNTLAGDQRSDVAAEDVGWVPFTSATLANWQQYQGIRVMVRGPKAQTNSLLDMDYVPDPVTFTWVGELNVCDQTINLTYSGNAGDSSTPGAGNAGDSRFNLIANPYPAPLDMGTVAGADRNLVDANFHVWEPRRPYASGARGFGPGGGRAGRYRSVPFSSANVQERTLPIGSAFFLGSNAVGPPNPNTIASITFRENYKLSTRTPSYAQPDAGSLFRTEESDSDYGANSLQLLISEGENDLDRVIVYFKDDSEAAKDYWDGEKMANDDMNFFTVSSNNWALAIDSRPWEEGERYPLHILAPEGTFTMSVPDYAMDAGRQVSIFDRYTEQTYELAKGESINFQVTDDPASKGHRFEIVMGAEVVTSLDASVNGLQVFLLPNPAVQQVAITVNRHDTNMITSVRVMDMRGVKVHETQLSIGEEQGRVDYPVGNLPKGVYLVEVQQGKQRVVKKLIVK